MRTIIVLACAFVVSACAAEKLVDGTVLVQPPVAAGTDFRVLVINRSGVGFSGDDIEDRKRTAIALLKSDACLDPEVVSEKVMRWGSWPFGTPRVTYYADWKCE